MKKLFDTLSSDGCSSTVSSTLLKWKLQHSFENLFIGGGMFWKDILNVVLNGKEVKSAPDNFCCLGIGNLTVFSNSDRTKFSQNYYHFEELVVQY
jgi:hypothetical protein